MSRFYLASGQYAAAIAIGIMATLIVEDLPSGYLWLKCAAFAAAVCWSFARLRMGPAFCTLIVATLATDYWVIEPVHSLSLDAWTAAALTGYFFLGLLFLRLNALRRENI